MEKDNENSSMDNRNLRGNQGSTEHGSVVND